jgi:serine phosphatase RsbU (regulator of sigma subunit)
VDQIERRKALVSLPESRVWPRVVVAGGKGIDSFLDSRTVVDLIAVVAVLGSALLTYAFGDSRRRDRSTIARLQRALTHTFPQLPGLSVGSAVLSASPGVGVGGDIVDVFELDGRFSMLLVADISGKGVEAAAHTAFVKYTIRTLALENDGDPAIVLAKFNAMYTRSVTDGETFVVLILGIIDSQTGDLRYASAGHEPAFVRRRGGRVTLLEPTGPIIGAAQFSAYRSAGLTLERGDLLVWTTDGMTESRDRNRRLLGVEGLAAWIAGAPNDVVGVADWLVGSLRRRSGSAGQDDVAVLAVAYDAAASYVASRAMAPLRCDALLNDLRNNPFGS